MHWYGSRGKCIRLFVCLVSMKFFTWHAFGFVASILLLPVRRRIYYHHYITKNAYIGARRVNIFLLRKTWILLNCDNTIQILLISHDCHEYPMFENIRHAYRNGTNFWSNSQKISGPWRLTCRSWPDRSPPCTPNDFLKIQFCKNPLLWLDLFGGVISDFFE